MMGSKSISEMGNIVFDYACNSFLAAMNLGSFHLVSIYQMSDKIVAILLNIVGGTLADRVARKRLLCIAELASGTVCLALAFFCSNDSIIVGVVAANVILAVFSSFSGPAYRSVIKESVYNNHIKRLNSAISTITMMTNIVSPIISVIIYQYFTLFGTLLFNGVSFLLSGLMLLFLMPIQVEKQQEERESEGSFFSNMKDGVIYLWFNKRLSLIIFFSALVNFFISGYNLLLPYSNGMFPVDQTGAYAIFLISEAVGGLVGAVVCPFLRVGTGIRGTYIQMALSGTALMSMPLLWVSTSNIYLVAVGPLLFNFFLSLFNINFFSYVHETVATSYLGRIFGVVFTVSLLFMPLGTMAFSQFLDPSLKSDYFLVGSCTLVCSVVFAVINEGMERTTTNNE